MREYPTVDLPTDLESLSTPELIKLRTEVSVNRADVDNEARRMKREFRFSNRYAEPSYFAAVMRAAGIYKAQDNRIMHVLTKRKHDQRRLQRDGRLAAAQARIDELKDAELALAFMEVAKTILAEVSFGKILSRAREAVRQKKSQDSGPVSKAVTGKAPQGGGMNGATP